MITNSQAQYPILYWIKWLKDEHGYIPSRVMINDSDTEIIAINKAYYYVNDDSSTNIFIDTYLSLAYPSSMEEKHFDQAHCQNIQPTKNYEGKESHARACVISNNEYDES